jgi:hypothetical protein
MTQFNSRRYILFFLFAWMMIAFFPGSYSVDSWYQYNEMDAQDYDDWHSPWMAYLWRVLFFLTRRFFTLYVLQMAWYFALWYFLIKDIRSRFMVMAALGGSIFFVFIPQYVMKDSLLALSWGSAAVILLSGDRDQPLYLRWTALLFLAYGLFLRLNTLPAMLPLLYIYADQYSEKIRRRSVWHKVLRTLVVSVFLGVVYFVTTYSIFHTRRAYPEYKLKLMDVIGISKLSGENLMPECITTYDGYNEEKIFRGYSPSSIDLLYWPPDNSSLFPHPTAALDQCLISAWRKAILQHPFLYLKNRFDGFLYYLRIKKNYKPTEYWNVAVWMEKNDRIKEPGSPWTPLTSKMVSLWSKLSRIHFYDPWLWLVMNSVLFVLFVTRYMKQKIAKYKMSAAIQLSAILYSLGMFPVYQNDRDFRYTYWNVMVAIIGTIYLFGAVGKDNEESETVISGHTQAEN